MDPEEPDTCACSCLCCSAPSATWRCSLKRKLEQLEEEEQEEVVALVDIENEAAALREALVSHQQLIRNLNGELEAERNAAASAANEAMSMILRLQREKAEAQMDARQFKLIAEEKMTHDNQEITNLEDLLFKREQALHSLSCQVEAYKHRLLSFGIPLYSDPQTPDAYYDYPPLRCCTMHSVDAADPDNLQFEGTPQAHLERLEQRIDQLERVPSSGSHFGSFVEKGVVDQSPLRPRHLRRFSVDSNGSGSSPFNKGEEFPMVVDRASDGSGRDDMCDRVYTIDAVHLPPNGYTSTPRGFGNRKDADLVEEEEIRNLYMRLEALEADRESMRQVIISMGKDKAQAVLLKEISQQLSKEVAPERRVFRRTSFIKKFSIMSAVKWIASIFFWRKKPTRIKYPFGLSRSNAGLLLLLDKYPRPRHRRYLTRT
ncbi:myosin-binding protein 7-like [Typha angustifolia]|uniref:myosin-binding protein 7-like n=1 Tax=Typha angustifolia TaxID=59011 RepID=UPI003C2AE4DD